MRTGALLTAWVALTLAGFWIYDGRYRLPVEGRVATNPHEATALAVPGAKATLLAFYTPGCGCSRFAESHIASLARRFSPRGLRIVTVVEGRGEAPRFDGLVQDPNGRLARALGVSAAPARSYWMPRGERPMLEASTWPASATTRGAPTPSRRSSRCSRVAVRRDQEVLSTGAPPSPPGKPCGS